MPAVRAICSQIHEIEKDFLREIATPTFLHSLGHEYAFGQPAVETGHALQKHAANFLAMPKPAATHLWLRHNESVT
jgi:hypothetical protein